MSAWARGLARSEVKAKIHNPKGYAVTKHADRRPGDYLASVRRTNEHGHQAITHLHIRVGSAYSP